MPTSDATVSSVIGVRTLRGEFRVHLTGRAVDLRALAPILDEMAGVSKGPDDFLRKALPYLAQHEVVLADVFDVGPMAPSISIRDRVALIASRLGRTAEQIYVELLATFQAAEPEELAALLSAPADLVFVAGLVQSVLTDLDERRAGAVTQLRAALGPTAAYLVLGADAD